MEKGARLDLFDLFDLFDLLCYLKKRGQARFIDAVKVERIDLPTYGKTTHQAKALIGEAVVKVAQLAHSLHKPLVIEKLNFAKKKAELETRKRGQARFIYRVVIGKIALIIEKRSKKKGARLDLFLARFIFHHKVKTTGFQPVSFSCDNAGAGGARWVTDTVVIRSFRLSITLYG